jgi:hypothetical protein
MAGPMDHDQVYDDDHVYELDSELDRSDPPATRH